MKEINHRLGAVSSTYGMYSHITSEIYDGYELLEEYEDIIHSGAVFVASVMPVLEAGFTAITPDVASQIASVMRKFTDQGVVVWLRYGFEMNWYINPVIYPISFWIKSLLISSRGCRTSILWYPQRIYFVFPKGCQSSCEQPNGIHVLVPQQPRWWPSRDP